MQQEYWYYIEIRNYEPLHFVNLIILLKFIQILTLLLYTKKDIYIYMLKNMKNN